MFTIAYIGDQALVLGYIWTCGKQYLICSFQNGLSIQGRKRARRKFQSRPNHCRSTGRLRIDGVTYV